MIWSIFPNNCRKMSKFDPYPSLESLTVMCFLLLMEGIDIGSCEILMRVNGSRALEKLLGKMPVAVGHKRKDNIFFNI